MKNFAGSVGPAIPPGQAAYQFVGPTTTINLTGSTVVSGVAVAGLSTGTEPATQVYSGLCYREAAGTVLNNFVGGAYIIHAIVGPSRDTYTVVGATTLGAGDWVVGYCLRNNGGQAIDDNDYVNGWITY